MVVFYLAEEVMQGGFLAEVLNSRHLKCPVAWRAAGPGLPIADIGHTYPVLKPVAQGEES
ncbi:MAG: hypothetical protein OEL80_07420 [Desulfuromonadales bacterium]|nr:hypothetical protein [Desulfuromonadales bacterium]